MNTAGHTRLLAGAVIVLGFLCATARAPVAEETPLDATEYAERIDRAHDANRLSEAWRLSERAVLAHPDDPALRHKYGGVLGDVAHYREAAEQLERALALAPDDVDVDVMVGLAWSHWAAGNSARARAVSAAAIAKWPEDPQVLELDDNIQTEIRILSGEKLKYAPGSPGAFVNQLCARVAAGNLADVLHELIDPELLDELRRSTPMTGSTRDWARGSAKGLAKAWHRHFAGEGNIYRGYEVSNWPDAAEDGSTIVWVSILTQNKRSAQDVERMRIAFADPELAHLMRDDERRVLEGLEPADRERYFTAQQATVTSTYFPVAMSVARRDGRWVITDADLGGVMQLTKMAANIELLQDKGLVSRGDSPDLAGALAENLGKVVGVLLLLWLCFKLSQWPGDKPRDQTGSHSRPETKRAA